MNKGTRGEVGVNMTRVMKRCHRLYVVIVMERLYVVIDFTFSREKVAKKSFGS